MPIGRSVIYKRFALPAFLIVSLLPASADAYPIFFKCTADGAVDDVLTGIELEKQLQAYIGSAASAAQKKAAVDRLCAGKEDCEKQLGQILDLTGTGREVADKMLEEELNRLEASSASKGIQEVSGETFDLFKSSRDLAFDTAACRNTMSRLPASSFANGDKLKIYYPYYSNYMYITGCRKKKPEDDWSCGANSKSKLAPAIKNAIAMGADPYLYLAIGLMEGGANGWEGLYLDPIGKMGALGCREVSVNAGKPKEQGTGMLHSYGNVHEIAPGVSNKPVLASRLQAAMKAAGRNVSGGTSYFCRGTATAQGSYSGQADPTACCLKLDFACSDCQLKDFEKPFVAGFVEQVQTRQLRGKTDPAYRIQKFNGYSKLMGAAESVSTFRMGVNYYDTPAYGYQSMDYILNSLVTNPYIRAMIEAEEKSQGRRARSVLCEDRAKPGTYVVDSTHYYKKHQESPRMTSLIGRGWSELREREKKVMLQEFRDPEVSRLLEENGCKSRTAGSGLFETVATTSTGKTLSGLLPDNLLSLISESNPSSVTVTLVSNGSQTSETVYTSIEGVSLTPTASGPSFGTGKVLSKMVYGNGTTAWFKNGVYEKLTDAAGQPAGTHNIDPSSVTVHFVGGGSYSSKTKFIPNAPFKAPSQGYATKYKFPSGKWILVETGPQGFKSSKDSGGCTDEKRLAIYWKTIYPKRRTVGLASDLEWRAMDSGTIQEIKERL